MALGAGAVSGTCEWPKSIGATVKCGHPAKHVVALADGEQVGPWPLAGEQVGPWREGSLRRVCGVHVRRAVHVGWVTR